MSSDYKRGYSKGYAAGRKGQWSIFRPAAPPDQVIKELVESVVAFRSAVDGELAKFSEDDELQTTMGGPMDRVTEALVRLEHWSRTGESPTAPETKGTKQ